MSATDPGDEADVAALKARYPDWDIYRVFGGWEAVPAGTQVLRAMFAEALESKLAEQEGRDGPPSP